MTDTKKEILTAKGTSKKVGAVMVVGAGISGIQTSLDLANSGFKVYLVDKDPAIGGKMAQLDKTFPTNDCSMCVLSPKLNECAKNPNISIITYAEVQSVEGEAGNFQVTLRKKPRYVNEDICRGCPTCIEYCPITIPHAYNANLSTTKCINIPYSQAVPAVPVIDPTACRFILKKECQNCVPACKNNAIDFHQKEQELKLNVGSVILSPGYETFDPKLQSEYGYKRYANVVTGLEFERLLSASGPNKGELKRLADGKAPKKIAWIQCIGSRDKATGNNYCSAVCCMYAIKQVILSEENIHGLEATVFHNDVRAYGKGFERYYDRAKKAAGARFIWSKVTIVREMPGTGNVVIRYRASNNEMKEEEFELVVLSVGLTIPPETKELANKLSIKLNSYGFCESTELSPMVTSRLGIYASGVFHAPKDIPDSVTMACGAASLSEQLLADQRGTLITEKKYPVERDITGEPPRVGVFVCRCGTNIGRIVDTEKTVSYAKTLPNVVYSEVSSFICSIDSITHITETIKKHGLNRVVVAACTPRTHEPLFQAALKEAGLNPYLFEMANIREHCSWVHMADKKGALQKAEDLIRMAVAKVTLLSPLYELSYDINHNAMVIGGGVSGMVNALALAKQGFGVHLVEKTGELGGMAKKIHSTIEGKDVQSYINGLVKQIHKTSLIKVHTMSEVGDIAGFVGNFKTKIVNRQNGNSEEIAHGATIVATGGNELNTNEYLHGQDPRVLTQMELEQEITGGGAKLAGVQTMVMILCVGSRNTERPYCSRVCCSQSIKNALKLKKLNPDIEIYIMYRDIRTYGLKEDYYKEAAEQGIRFIRYEIEDKPELKLAQENGKEFLRVTVTDPLLGDKLQIDADLLSLAVATVAPEGNKALSQMLKVPVNEDSFFMEAHMKLRPVDFSTDGIFMCGLAHYPKTIEESVAQAEAAASRASTILSKNTMKADARVCSVDETICSGCGICEAVCSYGAISVIRDRKVSVVNEALCKGCGTCAAACPSGAVGQRGFRCDQISAAVAAALK